MSSFLIGELSSPLEKKNNSFKKHFKTPKEKISRNEPFKDTSNRLIINKTNSLDFSIDFLESIEKCMKSFSMDINNNEEPFPLNLLKNNKKNNSALGIAPFRDSKYLDSLYFDDKDILNNLDSLIQKSNNLGVIQDSVINRIFDGKSFEGESPSLNHENDFIKAEDKKIDQNDTCLYQIEQILKNFDEDEEKKNKVYEEIIEKQPRDKPLPLIEHIKIINEEILNEKNKPIEKKRKKDNKCCIF